MTIIVKKPEILQNKYHYENEEKPIVDAQNKISENYHGGDEVTESVNDQRFAVNESEQQNNQNSEQNKEETEQQNDTLSQQDSEQTNQQSSEEQQSVNDNKQQQTSEDQNEEEDNNQQTEQQNNDDNIEHQQSSSDQQTQDDNNEDEDQQNNQENEHQQSSDHQNQHTKDQQQNNQNSEQHDNNEDEQNEEENGQQSPEEEEDNEENEQSSEDEEDTSEDEEQENTTEYNTEEVAEISKKSRIIKKLYLEFYRLVEYLADEEKVPSTVPGQSIILNIRKLMFRQYEHKPISSYYYYKARSQVVLILDNSGSMDWLVEELNTFFKVALKRRDIEIYIAPNGNIEKYYDFRKKDFVEINHEDAMNQIRQSSLPIIYIGDFDGANTPVELSWTNRTYWICPETRYKYFKSHDWVKYDEEDFKGFFGRAFNDEEIIEVLQQFSKNVMKQKFWYDKHDEKEFEDYYN